MTDFKSLMDCLEAKKVRSEVRSVGRREIPGSGGTETERLQPGLQPGHCKKHCVETCGGNL